MQQTPTFGFWRKSICGARYVSCSSTEPHSLRRLCTPGGIGRTVLPLSLMQLQSMYQQSTQQTRLKQKAWEAVRTIRGQLPSQSHGQPALEELLGVHPRWTSLLAAT